VTGSKSRKGTQTETADDDNGVKDVSFQLE